MVAGSKRMKIGCGVWLKQATVKCDGSNDRARAGHGMTCVRVSRGRSGQAHLTLELTVSNESDKGRGGDQHRSKDCDQDARPNGHRGVALVSLHAGRQRRWSGAWWHGAKDSSDMRLRPSVGIHTTLCVLRRTLRWRAVAIARHPHLVHRMGLAAGI